MLGVRLRLEEGDDLAAVAIRVGRELGTTYVLTGMPPPRKGIGRLRGGGEAFLGRLLEGLPGVDVRVLADPALRRPALKDEHAPLEDEELLKSGGVRVRGGEGLGADGDLSER
jgi:hypothetical protein